MRTRSLTATESHLTPNSLQSAVIWVIIMATVVAAMGASSGGFAGEFSSSTRAEHLQQRSRNLLASTFGSGEQSLLILCQASDMLCRRAELIYRSEGGALVARLMPEA